MQTDIKEGHFAIKYAPKAFKPYLKLARVDRPVGTWLLLLPCLWGLAINNQLFNFYYLALFSVGAFLMRSAGCVINDMWDQKLDSLVARTQSRPLANGTLTKKQALTFLALLLTLSLFILLQFNVMTDILGVTALIMVIIYPLMKRFIWWPQAFLGLTFNWSVLMATSATTNHITQQSLLLYIAGIFWTLAYDTIYAHQDKEDDALIGIKSTARLFGTQSKKYISAFFILCLGLVFIASNFSIYIFIPAMHAFWQVYTWDMEEAKSSLTIFKSNVIFGWLILAILAMCHTSF